MHDLFVLAADNNIKFALTKALARHQSLETRPFTFQIETHPHRDGGARTSGPELLRLQRGRFACALLVFDLEGCGAGTRDAVAIEAELDRRLAQQWNGNAKAIVIDPESDAWIWGNDQVLEEVLGWDQPVRLRDWLGQLGFVFNADRKPLRPKEAMERVASHLRVPRSSSLYGSITARISLQNCIDPAFVRLRDFLRSCFPPL